MLHIRQFVLEENRIYLDKKQDDLPRNYYLTI